MTRPGRRMGAMLAAACWLLVCAVPGARADQSLQLHLQFSAGYGDNILQYSDAQILVFESGLSPERFGITSTDDVLLEPSVALAWRNRMSRSRSRSVQIGWSGDFHGTNGTVDYGSVGGKWRESFSRDKRFTLSAYWAPGYYLRELLDEDVPMAPRYRRAEFDLGIGSIAWRQRLAKNTRAGINYRYERRNYNPSFVERSSNTHQGGLDVEFYRLPGHGAVDFYGAYRMSDAKGTDADPDSNEADVSYRGVVAGLRGRVEFARGANWRFGANLGYELHTRSYLSDRPADRYHYGRDDLLNHIDVGLYAPLWSHWTIRGTYMFETNSAHLGALAPPGTETGNYSENQVGLSLEWTGEIWGTREPSSDEE